jgi:hypothetical protein
MVPSDGSPVEAAAQPPRRRDGLTILRIMLLTAGVGAGIQVFGPDWDGDWSKNKGWLGLANSIVIGLSLPAPLFLLSAVWRKDQSIGPASLFAMAMGIGSLLLLPPPIIAALTSHESAAVTCLYYIMPQAGLWFLLAAALTGQIGRRLFDRCATPWTERYGYSLALLWSPLGLWHLVNYYREALQGGSFFDY